MRFFNFCLFHFSKFQVAIVKNLIKKPYFFISHKYFDLHTFDNETTALLKVFEISTEMHFVSLFFLNERKITTSILMIQLKSTVVHYAIINSSTISKPFLRVVEYAISFFSIFCLSLFQQDFCQQLYEKLPFFNMIFRNSLQDVVCYIILGCQTL